MVLIFFCAHKQDIELNGHIILKMIHNCESSGRISYALKNVPTFISLSSAISFSNLSDSFRDAFSASFSSTTYRQHTYKGNKSTSAYVVGQLKTQQTEKRKKV